VEAAYTGDLNGSCTLTIAWGAQGTDWGDASISSVNLPYQPTPFRYKITGLNNFQMYQVKVVFHDDEGVDNGLQEQILLSQVPHNSMVHSSYTTGSLKWSARGGWGLPGTQYGEFSCKTCHAPKTGNIKRIRKELTATVNGSPDVFPIQAEGGLVTFLNTNKGVSQFGDDLRLPADSSTNVCEACHSKNKYHNYNTINNQATDHYNRDTCTGCHQHNQGFKASCEGCHPAEPVMASHDEHYNSAIMNVAFSCDVCHATSEHRNTASEVRFAADLALVAGSSYSEEGGDESSCYTEDSGYCTTPVYGTCNTLYCHSNANPLSGTNAYSQPTWGAAPLNCQSCHDPVGGTQAMSAPHGRHTDAAAYGYECAMCHDATATGSSAILDASLHLNQIKDVSLSVTGTYNAATFDCNNVYCHTDGRLGENTSPGCLADELAGCHYVGGVSTGDKVSSLSIIPNWSESGYDCAACHKGRPQLEAKNAQMDSNGHFRLANEHWIRQYACSSCHYKTVDTNGVIKFADGTHVNEQVDVAFDPKWRISGYPVSSYNAATMVCDNIYCHSDGTTVDPVLRAFPWNKSEHANCDSCHGHMENENCEVCHGGDVPQWSPEDQWKRAMPMYANSGPGTERANSHLRHLETEFSCENCHFTTVVGACGNLDCHGGGIPEGTMTEVGHVNASIHVNKIKDVVFKDGGTYDPATKRCANTACHTGDDPQWGDTRNGEVLCLTCHGTTEADINDFDAFNGTQGKINMVEWASTGHGRPVASGNYPSSANPASNFPGNPCWYCHDNNILHKDEANPLRLKIHPQFEARFAKECVYCHMEGQDSECLGCHNAAESLSPQLANIGLPTHLVDHTSFTDGQTGCLTSGCHLPMEENQCLTCHKDNGNPAAPQMVPDKVQVGQTDPPYAIDHYTFTDGLTNCLSSRCHSGDAHIHNTGSGFWTLEQKDTVRNQYLMMGVCLQCHDDDSSGKCTECHTGDQYKIGYNPGTGFISASSKITGFHFGFKHEERHQNEGVWPGGMFCWDCHDPHGDKNIYMIQKEVATTNDGNFGFPLTTGEVNFTKAISGLDYAKNSPPFDGVCNVCHMATGQHYRFDYGDGHQSGRVCTSCHNHSFSDGHASGEACNSCHGSKPIPRHTAFSQPRDCTKCHEGAILKRVDVMRQLRGKSHHIQGVEIDNKHCYACHWEATEHGLVNPDYHEGYNYKTHESLPNAKNDLVVWGPNERPQRYDLGVTAETFTAAKIGTAEERSEVASVSAHCLGCHSDQNNEASPFDDCKTPRKYAWDRSSIAARYSQTGTATWGKTTLLKQITKSLSAHGNAVNNAGGFSAATGEDGTLPNTRAGTDNVQCYDCHSSHGSYTVGVTSSYLTFDGTRNGGNLKETQAGKGGYGFTYRAQAITTGISPVNAGAAQCFDCHETQNGAVAGKPWGYQSTFGASQPIHGYKDTPRFQSGSEDTARMNRYIYRKSNQNWSGHFKPTTPLAKPAMQTLDGLCSPCHDPHGVSPSLGANQAYGVPLLKGTWMSSPYREDHPVPTPGSTGENTPTYSSSASYTADDTLFAGLCLRCHPKGNLTDGSNRNTAWKSVDRVHETVKGWGLGHKFTCSKCHAPHVSNMPRLMVTNCLDVKHKGNVVSGGVAVRDSGLNGSGQFPTGQYGGWNNTACHGVDTGTWTNQFWNKVTPW
jgi:predicted CxxxxCH...CXXCH cytochrome family protein